MKLIFVRHAEPDYSVDSLTEKGFKEAEMLSERIVALNPDYIYCSPLGRAKDTAKPSLEKLGRDAVICDWLEEFNGKIIDENTGNKRIPWDLLPRIWTKTPELYSKDLWIKTPIMQSGNVEQRYNEVCQEFDKLLLKHGYKKENGFYHALKSNHDTIVFFCHFGVESVLLSHILGMSPLSFWQGFVALPSSVTTLITEEREEGISIFRCNGFGDVSHLYKHGEPASFMARFCETFDDEERH